MLDSFYVGHTIWFGRISLYVHNTPSSDTNWGYVQDVRLAKPLTLDWAIRFTHDMSLIRQPWWLLPWERLMEQTDRMESSLIEGIIAYEEGRLDEDRTVELFQKLIDTGLAWSLQGHYGRTATDLIQSGACQPRS